MASEDGAERSAGSKLVASPRARLVMSTAGLLVASADGGVIELAGDTGELARTVIAFLREPRSRRDVVDHVTLHADEPFEDRVVFELLDVLEGAGALEVATFAEAAIAADGRHVLLTVCGAIQAAEAPRMVMELQRLGFDVRVARSEAARRFVSDDALRALLHRPIPESLWSNDANEPVPHIEMAGWADLVLVYPATATTLSRIATGDCSDLVSAIAIATRAPVVLVPSMNDAMLTAPAVARNIESLLADGYLVLSPSSGIEVAERPGDRSMHHGAALAPHEVAALVPMLLDRYGTPREAVDWDAVYARGDTPWEAPEADGVLLAALRETPPPRSVLEIGAGTGAFSIAAAKEGYRVAAADLSDEALRRARVREGGGDVLFLRDDIRETRLRSTFDVLVDRGCFHTLRDVDAEGYVMSIQSLCAPRGRLLVVHDAPDASALRKTRRIAPTELAAFLPGFSFVRSDRTTLVSAEGATAWLTVLERTSPI